MARTGIFELNALVALATHRNFRAAAAELGMSPSALSHAVSTMEERIGVRLFNRTTRSVALSEAGEQFLARVRPALREIADAIESVNAFRESVTGTLRINTSDTAARTCLMPIVFEYLKRHPDMRVEIVTQTQFVDIVAEGFDAGVRLADSVPKDMIAVPCAPDVSFAVVGAPRYFKGKKRPQTPADLLQHNCIRRRWPSGAIYRWELERHNESLVMDVQGTLTLDQDDLMVTAAVRGIGLAYVSEWTVVKELAAGKLVRVLSDWTPAFGGPRLYYPSQRHATAGLRAFVKVVRELNKRPAAAL